MFFSMNTKKLKQTESHFLVLLTMSMLCLPSVVKGQVSQLSGSPSNWYSIVDQHVKKWYEMRHINGAELMVVQNDSVVLHNVYGWDDREESIVLKKGQLFNIGALSKPIIATAVFILLDQRKLSLDDKVSKYLKEFNTDERKNITIKELLDHSSGISHSSKFGDSSDFWRLSSSYALIEEETEALGQIVEKVSGLMLERFIVEKIFRTLELKDAYCLLRKNRPPREKVCSAYEWTPGGYIKSWDNETPVSAQFYRVKDGMFLSAQDYATFLTVWMKRGQAARCRILSENSIKRALTSDEEMAKTGKHWQLFHLPTQSTDLPIFGQMGGGSLVMALPEQKAMLLYFTQSKGSFSPEIIAHLVLQELGFEKKKEIREHTVDDAIINQYTGEYGLPGEIVTVLRSETGLNLFGNTHGPLSFVPVSDTTFVHRILDMSIHFEASETGVFETLFVKIANKEVSGRRKW